MVLLSSVRADALYLVHVGRVEVATDDTICGVVRNRAIIAVIVAKVSLALSTQRIFTMRLALMDTTLASLSESLLTSIDAADEGLFARVRIHVFSQVLLKREFFVAAGMGA